MAKTPTKVATRIATGIKRFQPILESAKSRDIGESDTVTIVVDMLADIFGYDKFSEVTSEHAIKGTYCDLATKLDGALQMLIEVKAIGLDLKAAHVKQAIDYAANQGVDWVVLTNALTWRVYKVTFAKPISQEMVIELDFCTLNPKISKDIESLYLFCKEGWIKSVLGKYHEQKLALSRFSIGALILSDPVVKVLRHELRRLTPDLRVEPDEIRSVLVAEVLKREVTEGEQAAIAKKKIAKTAAKQLRSKKSKANVIDGEDNGDSGPSEAETQSDNSDD